MKQICRPLASAACFMDERRCTLDANCVAMTRPDLWLEMRRMSASVTSASDVDRPGASTFVESDISMVTPSLDISSKRVRLSSWPSTGFSSIFQSPV